MSGTNGNRLQKESLSEEIFGIDWHLSLLTWLFTEGIAMKQGTDSLKEQKEAKKVVLKATSFTGKAFPFHKIFRAI